MKVLIMDEQSLFRDGLSLRLKQINQDITILQASSIDEMQRTLSQTPFIDVVIFDVDLAELNIGDIVNKIKISNQKHKANYVLPYCSFF